MGQPINPFQNAVGPAALPSSGPGSSTSTLPGGTTAQQEPDRDNNVLAGFLSGAGEFIRENALGIGLHAASLLYQNHQRRKLKRKINELAEQSRGIEIRFTPASGEVGVSYGYTASAGLPFYAQVAKSLPSVPGTFGTLAASPGESQYNEYLLVQYVITAAGISRLLDIHVNGDPWESEGVSELVSHELTQNVASAHAIAFTSERDANSIANGFAVVNGFYKYDQDDPLVYGIPHILSIHEGEEVRALTSTGFGDKAFSNNAARCFADYLTNSIYGPKIPDDRIDQEIWALSVQRAEATAPAAGIPDFHGVNISKFKRYEVNGELSSPGNWLDSVSAFMMAMPGADFWRRLNGKWALLIPETSNRTNEQRTEGNVISESDLLSPPAMEHPNTSTRLNRQTVEFPNMFLDFGSDADTFNNSDFEKQDGGIVLENTIGVELCATPYHGRFINSVNVKTSRRPVYRMVCRPYMMVYEPGDTPKLHAPHFGFENHYIKIQNMSLDVANNDGDLIVNLAAIQYDKDDYTYSRGTGATMQGVPKQNYRPGLISGALLELLPNKVRQLLTTWNIETADNNTSEFLVQLAEMQNESDPIPESAWIPIGTVPAGQERKLPHNITDLPRCYTSRVIPITSNGVRGKPVVTNTVAVTDARIDNLTCLDRPNTSFSSNAWTSLSENIPSNWQTAFDVLNLGLNLGGAKLPSFNVPIRPGSIASEVFTPTADTDPDFVTPSGTKGFLYQAGGQIFGRVLQQLQQSPQEQRQGLEEPPPGLGQISGFTEAISLGEVRGEVCPLPDEAFPELPRRALYVPNINPLNYFKGDVIDLILPEAQFGTPPYTYSIMGLPSWLKFDPLTRRLRGTAPETGTIQLQYCVEDAA